MDEEAKWADAYDKLEASLADMPRQIGRTPRAILMVSAHWEAPAFTVKGNPQPAHDLRLRRLPGPHLPGALRRAGLARTGAPRAVAARGGRPACGARRRARLRPRHVLADGRDLPEGRRAGGAAVAAARARSGRAHGAGPRDRAAARRERAHRRQRPELSQPAQLRPAGARCVEGLRRLARPRQWCRPPQQRVEQLLDWVGGTRGAHRASARGAPDPADGRGRRGRRRGRRARLPRGRVHGRHLRCRASASGAAA